MKGTLHSADTDKFSVIRGQAVFHITDYFNGYRTGAVVVKVTEAQVPSCRSVLGQVTPEVVVCMTMCDAETTHVRSNPVGRIVKVKGTRRMVNRMISPALSWSYRCVRMELPIEVQVAISFFVR